MQFSFSSIGDIRGAENPTPDSHCRDPGASLGYLDLQFFAQENIMMDALI
jgi:hypothetical protein